MAIVSLVSVATTPMPLNYEIGDEPVPGYRLTSFLGQGGFGKVWRSTAPGGTEAALKIIDIRGVEGKKEFRSLRLVKRIHHPNLVPITAVWLKSDDGKILDDAFAEHDQLPLGLEPTERLADTLPSLSGDNTPRAVELIIAMGLGDRSLYDRLDQCRREDLDGIPCDELLGYMEEAAKAIDFLNSPVHDLGAGPVAIQHCDIKPHNLMVVANSTQVCDFGLARDMGVTRTTTSSAATLAYAAPECLDGKPSAATDQYSLAVSYYELRTGKLPYRTETYLAVTADVLSGNLDFSKAPEAERKVLHRATALDPANRYSSVTEMVASLRRAAETARQHSDAPAKKSSVIKLSLFAAAAVLVALTAWLIFDPAARSSLLGLLGRADGNANPTDDAAPSEAEALLATATAHVEKGEFDQAVGCIERIGVVDPDYKSRPDYARAYLGRGTEYLAAGDFPKAIDDFSDGLVHDPDDARLYSRLGTAWFYLGDWSNVVASCTKAIQIDANDLDLVNRGRAYKKLEILPNAIADFQKAATVNPENGDAHYLLAECYLEANAYNEATDAYTSAIGQHANTDNPLYALAHAHLWRGYCFLEMDELDRADDDFTNTLNARAGLNPGDLEDISRTLHQLAAALARADRLLDAIRWEEKAVELATGQSQQEYQLRLDDYQARALDPPSPNP